MGVLALALSWVRHSLSGVPGPKGKTAPPQSQCHRKDSKATPRETACSSVPSGGEKDKLFKTQSIKLNWDETDNLNGSITREEIVLII